jgi:predicted ATPase with chaperone activity
VLFLDEFTEFRRDAIEWPAPAARGWALGRHADGGSVVFPARFTLVAAASPCPCGFDLILAASAVGRGRSEPTLDGGRNYFWTVQVPRKR